MVDRTDEERRQSWAMGLSMATGITIDAALSVVDEIDEERAVMKQFHSSAGSLLAPPERSRSLPG